MIKYYFYYFGVILVVALICFAISGSVELLFSLIVIGAVLLLCGYLKYAFYEYQDKSKKKSDDYGRK